jgi:hypothetical protein
MGNSKKGGGPKSRRTVNIKRRSKR